MGTSFDVIERQELRLAIRVVLAGNDVPASSRPILERCYSKLAQRDGLNLNVPSNPNIAPMEQIGSAAGRVIERLQETMGEEKRAIENAAAALGDDHARLTRRHG